MNFDIHCPFLESERLLAFMPNPACHEDYTSMLQDTEFRKAYGVAYTKEEALLRLAFVFEEDFIRAGITHKVHRLVNTV